MDYHAERMASTIQPRRISLKRRLAFISIIYLTFLGLLLAIEAGTRLTMDHVYSLDLFVVTPQQKAQVAEGKQSAIFEGDPLLMWRLRPNLDQAYWDFTTVSTNAQHLRHDRPLQAKEPGTFRIVSLGDSVTFGYRVPPVWPDKPKDFNPVWVPYPTLLERTLRAANPNRKIEVITMAVPGYTSHQGLAWLRRDIDDLAAGSCYGQFRLERCKLQRRARPPSHSNELVRSCHSLDDRPQSGVRTCNQMAESKAVTREANSKTCPKSFGGGIPIKLSRNGRARTSSRSRCRSHRRTLSRSDYQSTRS